MLSAGRSFFTLALVTSTLASTALASTAQADTKSECLLAHTRGQELRLEGKWQAAQQLFRTCASASQSCPGPLVEDCTRWAEELRASMPSVLVAASDPDGNDTVEAVLIVDGVHAAERLPATSIKLDPGEHVVRLEHSDWVPIETHLVLRDGEKDKRLVLRFERASTSRSAKTPTAANERRSALPGVVALGFGVAALGVGVPFVIAGRNKETDLAGQPCGVRGTCEPSQVDVARRDYWIGGIVSGVGVLAVAFGAWHLLTHSNPRSSTVVVDGSGLRGVF